MRVLVIDDEPDILTLCRVNLEHAGHEVLEAATAEEGLEIALRDPPGLIVLDIMLPNRDGFSLLEELVVRPETSEIPVVLLTARAQLEDKIKGWRAGAAGYVTKPFAPATLTETVGVVKQMTPEERTALRSRALGDLDPAS